MLPRVLSRSALALRPRAMRVLSGHVAAPRVLAAVRVQPRFFSAAPPAPVPSSASKPVATTTTVSSGGAGSGAGSGSGPKTAAATGFTAKFRELWNKYGWVGVGTYFAVYGVTLGGMYLLVSSHVIGKRDVSKWVKKLGLENHVDISALQPQPGQKKDRKQKASTFLVAWLGTKLTEPLRLMVTLAITPRLSRYLRPGLHTATATAAAPAAAAAPGSAAAAAASAPGPKKAAALVLVLLAPSIAQLVPATEDSLMVASQRTLRAPPSSAQCLDLSTGRVSGTAQTPGAFGFSGASHAGLVRPPLFLVGRTDLPFSAFSGPRPRFE